MEDSQTKWALIGIGMLITVYLINRTVAKALFILVALLIVLAYFKRNQ